MITMNCNLFLLMIMMIMIMCKFVFTWPLVSSSSYHSQKKRFFLLDQQQHLTSFNLTTTNVSTSMNRRRSSATKLKKNHDGYSDIIKSELELGSNSLELIKKNNFRVTSLIGKTVTLTCSIELDEVEFTKAANYRVTYFIFLN